MSADTLRRLQALEDRMEIQQLAARFSDAVNERDVATFGGLWAESGSLWEIGEPLPSRAEGRAAIIAMFEGLLVIEPYFMQMTHSGVVTVKGDRATARYAIREHGRGTDSFYDNLAVYDDELVREAAGWRFLRRSYAYRFLSQKPFSDTAYPAALRTPRS